MRARSWRAYLPAFREDRAFVRYDVWFYSCLSLTFVEFCSVCAAATPGQWSLNHIRQAGDSSEVKSCARAEIKCLCCHISFDSFTTTCSPPPVNFHISALCLDFIITLLAPIHWSLCHFPSGTPSSTTYFSMAYFILLPFCQKGSKIHLDPYTQL